MNIALICAISTAVCYGVALVTSRIGLRTLDARAGAAISIPTAALLFVLAAPFGFSTAGFDIRGLAVFAVVGLFFPVLVTVLTFRATKELGPTITGSVSGTAPLFSFVASSLILGEHIPGQAIASGIAVAAGIALLSWKDGAARKSFPLRALLWPFSGAAVRGIAQTGAKAGLTLWSSPFTASLIAYLISSVTIICMDRARHREKTPASGQGRAWFALTGALNGFGVLTMYTALDRAPVSFVAPVVSAYPLVAAAVSALVLRDEVVTLRMAVGAAITFLAVAYLVMSGPA